MDEVAVRRDLRLISRLTDGPLGLAGPRADGYESCHNNMKSRAVSDSKVMEQATTDRANVAAGSELLANQPETRLRSVWSRARNVVYNEIQ